MSVLSTFMCHYFVNKLQWCFHQFSLSDIYTQSFQWFLPPHSSVCLMCAIGKPTYTQSFLPFLRSNTCTNHQTPTTCRRYAIYLATHAYNLLRALHISLHTPPSQAYPILPTRSPPMHAQAYVPHSCYFTLPPPPAFSASPWVTNPTVPPYSPHYSTSFIIL